MKKLIIPLVGLFTLVACSEDYEKFDNSDVSANNEQSSSNYTNRTHTGSADGYKSPWDGQVDFPIGYFMETNLQANEGLFIRVTPYIGLAYYDGIDDGIYYAAGNKHDLTSGNYPNLIANGREYGNYVQANPIVLANTGSWYTHELMIFAENPGAHCPLDNVSVGYNYNLEAIKFDIINNDIVQPALLGSTITPAPVAGTLEEQFLLSNFGKVMYYKIEFGYDAYNYEPDVYYVLALECDPAIDATEWTGLNNLTDSFNGNLFYHSGGTTPTSEIIVDVNSVVGVYPNMEKSMQVFGTSVGERTIVTQSFHYWGAIIPGNPIPYNNIHIGFY